MAAITFYANVNATNTGVLINHGAGSGLGFYGNGYGVSVPIGSQQDSTWLTNSNGTESTNQVQLHNTKYQTAGDASTAGTVSSNSLTAISNNNLPNFLCPLNIRFEHTEAVRVQNCKLRIFDRSNVANHASGVVTYVYEGRHPATSQSQSNLAHRGRTANSWVEFDSTDSATPADMIFTNSPGISGLNTDSTDTSTDLGYSSTQGAAHQSVQHDWYAAISAEPKIIGSKTNYGLYFTLEYL